MCVWRTGIQPHGPLYFELRELGREPITPDAKELGVPLLMRDVDCNILVLVYHFCVRASVCMHVCTCVVIHLISFSFRFFSLSTPPSSSFFLCTVASESKKGGVALTNGELQAFFALSIFLCKVLMLALEASPRLGLVADVLVT